MKKEDYYWYWLNNIEGIGRRTIRRLLHVFQTPEEIYQAPKNQVLDVLSGNQKIESFFKSRDEEEILKSYERLCEAGARFIHPNSEDYPSRFRVIPDAPLGLYIKGRFPSEGQKTIAIIGARSCTTYGKEMARFFGRELSKCGIAVISGLALGIDGMAHVGALEAGGYTLGVLGCGIDRIYPRENISLFKKMESTGGILSESNLGIEPFAGLFPQRNRLIAGISDGILVVEAMEKSGTFITVDQGLDQGKEIFALPGRVTDVKSAGCNNLIKLGAHMVTKVSDILEVFNVSCNLAPETDAWVFTEERINKMSLAPLEKMVYSCLGIEPKYLDDIISEARVAPQEVCIALNRMILMGVIAEPSKNYYAVRL